jgi:hypothetical protein
MNSSVSSVYSVGSRQVGAWNDQLATASRRGDLDTPSVSFSSLKLMIKPKGISSSFI